jgi:hypothetical protein
MVAPEMLHTGLLTEILWHLRAIELASSLGLSSEGVREELVERIR